MMAHTHGKNSEVLFTDCDHAKEFLFLKEQIRKTIFTEEDRPNIRASSIPRPRAVLSSPDNDAVIGNNYNKTKVARSSALKNSKVIQNRHELCKVVPSRIADASTPTNSRESKSTP
ncbi:hypothetical protein OIU79_004053 [Salix purpurea]|uniref:Uncharacterized protein n=1 Tax=Salix purpurea TaxID=77065 RepID=A0A9Q0Z8W8_SALPP|nr:hypothetical protein OIU79_004053 [Salix purpurea]